MNQFRREFVILEPILRSRVTMPAL
jgi:hypothetical protein